MVVTAEGATAPEFFFKNIFTLYRCESATLGKREKHKELRKKQSESQMYR